MRREELVRDGDLLQLPLQADEDGVGVMLPGAGKGSAHPRRGPVL